VALEYTRYRRGVIDDDAAIGGSDGDYGDATERDSAFGTVVWHS
jgi:hypothetical protein